MSLDSHTTKSSNLRNEATIAIDLNVECAESGRLIELIPKLLKRTFIQHTHT